jgi:hypothetical protein
VHPEKANLSESQARKILGLLFQRGHYLRGSENCPDQVWLTGLLKGQASRESMARKVSGLRFPASCPAGQTDMSYDG